MASFTAHHMNRDDDLTGPPDGSLGQATSRAAHLSLPGFGDSNTRSLFIFSEENFIRKYAKIIIEWGYPFSVGVNFGKYRKRCWECIVVIFSSSCLFRCGFMFYFFAKL